MLHPVQHVPIEAQPSKIVKIACRPVQQAHHDAFAIQRRQSGNAQVHFTAQRLDLDAPVLGQPPLGDVQLGHQLHARNHGCFHLAWRRLLAIQNAVHSIANTKFFFERLDVDVTGALFHSLSDNGVHLPDDGRLARHIAQVLQVLGRFGAFRVELRFATRRVAVIFVDRVQNFLLGREHRAHLQARAVTHCRNGFDIQRIRHRQRHRVIVAAHWQATELPQESRGERLGFSRNGRWTPNGYERNVQLLSQRRQDIPHRDEAHVDQRLAKLVTALFLQLERALQIFIRDELALDKNFAETHESELVHSYRGGQRRSLSHARFHVHQRAPGRTHHNLGRQALGVFAVPIKQRDAQRDLLACGNRVQRTCRVKQHVLHGVFQLGKPRELLVVRARQLVLGDGLVEGRDARARRQIHFAHEDRSEPVDVRALRQA